MIYNPDIHHRRSIRLKGYDYSQSGLYFVTICIQDKDCLFGKIVDNDMILNEYGKLIDNEWKCLKIKYPTIELHEYMIMPNHFHAIVEIVAPVGAGFARPDIHPDNAEISSNQTSREVNLISRRANPAPTVGNIIGYFKYQTTKKLNLSVKLWQRNYYEHIIRNEQSYQKISNYIVNNPANWLTDTLHYQQENQESWHKQNP